MQTCLAIVNATRVECVKDELNSHHKVSEGQSRKIGYSTKRHKLFDGIVKNLKFLEADGQILTAGKSGKVPPGQIKGTANMTEPFRYLYHPDDLGSTSYVTDASGEVYQTSGVLRFWRTFVEEYSNTERIPCLFELNEETGSTSVGLVIMTRGLV